MEKKLNTTEKQKDTDTRHKFVLKEYFTLACNLWLLREAYKLYWGSKRSIEGFYDDIGISKQTLNRLWNGSDKVFIAGPLKKISETYGIDPQYLAACRKSSREFSNHLILDTGEESDWDIWGYRQRSTDNAEGLKRENHLKELLRDKFKDFEEGRSTSNALRAFWSYYAHPLVSTMANLEAITPEEWKQQDTATLEGCFALLNKQCDIVETILKYRKL